MKVTFTYKKEKDIWCLLNKGKSSNNSQNPTKQYEQLVAKYRKNPTKENVAIFIEKYITENKIDILKQTEIFQKDWDTVSCEFQKRVESIFETSLPNDIIAYLTINSRCPYDTQNNLFYVYLESLSVKKTVMHELWHFYTWYGVGTDQEEKLGKENYNNLKEALTVLLNIECKDLLPEGVVDAGYPQHQELRNKIIEYWAKDKNIKNLWDYLSGSL